MKNILARIVGKLERLSWKLLPKHSVNIDSPQVLTICFVCDESYSLFKGGESGPRFGGAGLQMYLLADELSKIPNTHVVFAFEHISCRKLSHERIDIQQMSRIQPTPRAERIRSKVWFSTMSYMAPHMVELGQLHNEPACLWLASDADVNQPFENNRIQVQTAFRALTSVVAQSEYQAELLGKIVGHTNLVIKNGWPLEKPRSLRDEGDYILWVASAQALKQPWMVVDLAQKYVDEKFVIIMPPADAQVMEYVTRRVSSMNNIEFINRQISVREVEHYFARAKMFLNTSSIEGFPTTFLQAGAAGVPILSYSIDPDSVIERFRQGACAKGDYCLLEKLFSQLIGDLELRVELGENAFNYVQQNHNLPQIASQFRDHFLELSKAADTEQR